MAYDLKGLINMPSSKAKIRSNAKYNRITMTELI